MNQKKSKSLRRMARSIARETGNTALRYRTIFHNPRQVMVGWKPAEIKEDGGILKPVTGFLKRGWNLLKRLAGVPEPEPEQKPAPKSYVPDIRTVAPETHVLAGGIRFYLQRLKAACFYTRNKLSGRDLKRPDRAMMRTLVRQERAERFAELSALEA
jgi:hypothetical protein